MALRYQLQRGVVALAKSFNEERMRENFQVHGRAVGGRGLMEAPRLPLVWVIGEAPKVYLGQAHLLAYAMHASAVSNYPPHSVCCREGMRKWERNPEGQLWVSVLFFRPTVWP